MTKEYFSFTGKENFLITSSYLYITISILLSDTHLAATLFILENLWAQIKCPSNYVHE